ncbi:MAG: ferritin family protein [Nitrospirota bacterium]|nr:ferritin family protein [Nitrospirota bacterium]
MSINFNDIEALNISMNLEKEGQAFYAGAADAVRNPEIKKVFNFLAAEEADHYEMAKKLYEAHYKPELYSGEDELIMDDYLKRVVDAGVFPKADNIGTVIANIRSDAEAIEMAFKAEVDTMKFFSDAMRNTNLPEGKEIFKELIDQEKEHIRMLEVFRDERLRA